MPDIQVSTEDRRVTLRAFENWSRTLPRAAGQVSGPVSCLVEGPPAYASGETMPCSGFQHVSFLDVTQDFVSYLRFQGIKFDLI